MDRCRGRDRRARTRSGGSSRSQIAGERRYIAVEDAARYRDGLGTTLTARSSRHAPRARPRSGRRSRAALRPHARVPSPSNTLARRFGLGTAIAESLLTRLTESGRLVQGEFRPGGVEREWVDADVLRRLRSRSLARLRREVEPVSPDALGRFLVSWHGIGSERRGLEALLDAVEQLQGAPLAFSILEREVLPARVAGYQPSMLDTLMAAGEVVWAGVESLGEHDGRIALYLTDHMARLRPPVDTAVEVDGRASEILSYLRSHGASFFAAVHEGTGGGFPGETVTALWELVWKAWSPTTRCTRCARTSASTATKPSRRGRPAPFKSRRLVPPTGEGRWSLVDTPRASRSSTTEWSTAIAHQLARSSRRRDARDDRARTGQRRVLDHLPGAQGDGRCRTRASRILRLRPRRRAVRDACHARSASLAARSTGHLQGRRAVRDRSGVSVRLVAEVAAPRLGR